MSRECASVSAYFSLMRCMLALFMPQLQILNTLVQHAHHDKQCQVYYYFLPPHFALGGSKFICQHSKSLIVRHDS